MAAENKRKDSGYTEINQIHTDNTRKQSLEEKTEESKFEVVYVDKVIADKYINDTTPLVDRSVRVVTVRRFVTQFNGQHSNEKVREEGVEHEWITPSSTQYKTGNWQTIFQGKVESVKEIKLVETNPYSAVKMKDQNMIKREGTNEHGEFWTEEVYINSKTNVKKQLKTSHQQQHLRDDGFDKKWGESREEYPGQYSVGEKWEEMYKECDDYWQKTTERYEECVRKQGIEQQRSSSLKQAEPQLMRSGIIEFRNNRNFLNAEHWEEYVDGTLLKKIVNDNGYGIKKMIQVGMKLDIDKLEGIRTETDQNGYFKAFVDEDGNRYLSLKEMMEKEKRYLCWEYENITTEDLTTGILTLTKKG